jgi:hypothetical protein
VELDQVDGWNRLTITAANGNDIREDVFGLAKDKNWTLREMRREVASLEDFFVQITVQQRQAEKV